MKKLFVLGSGIGYSLSPTIFAKLFDIFGENGEYSIVDIPPAELCNIKKIAEGTVGFNVTKPFKREIIRYLSGDNSGFGSVNTVRARDMVGFSTDSEGFLFDLERNFPNASHSSVLLIGYGGAARACASALIGSGATLAITGRDEAKVRAFADEFGIRPYDGSFKPDGVVSCTTETYLPPVSKADFCYDLRYAGKTIECAKRNCNGLGMLIAQAIYSYGIFFDKRFDKNEVMSVYLKIRESL